MKRPDITDIFFDLDHTLWDFDRNSALAFQRIFRQEGIDASFEEFIKAYEPINFNYWKLYREERVTQEELRRGRFNDSFAKLGVSYPLSKIDRLSEAYIEELPKDNHLFDGALEVLEHLRGTYRMHIITNGFEEVQHLKMANSGIRDYFDIIMTSETAGVKKPNPIIFHTALEQAASKPSSSIMIGDTFEADILGAEAVGMDTLFYNYRKESVAEGYKVVDHIIEIKNYL